MPVFLESGFSSLANATARKTFAKVVSIEKACEKHGVDSADFLTKLNTAIAGKPVSASPAAKPSAEESPSAGKEIQQGEMCQPDTMVGSLIKVYPASKTVF